MTQTTTWNWSGMFFEENNYFGWNGLPKSDAEIICDLIILATSALLWGKK